MFDDLYNRLARRSLLQAARTLQRVSRACHASGFILRGLGDRLEVYQRTFMADEEKHAAVRDLCQSLGWDYTNDPNIQA